MPIIRIRKEQIEEANKAREGALLKDAEFRAYDAHRKFLRQVASKQVEQIGGANKAWLSP